MNIDTAICTLPLAVYYFKYEDASETHIIELRDWINRVSEKPRQVQLIQDFTKNKIIFKDEVGETYTLLKGDYISKSTNRGFLVWGERSFESMYKSSVLI